MLQLGFLLWRCCLLGLSSHCLPESLLGSLSSRRKRKRRKRAVTQVLARLGILQHLCQLPELLTTFFSSAEGSHSAAVCFHSSPMVPTSLMEERSYIYSFTSSTSHRARHKSNIKHMHSALLIYCPAWELRGFGMLLSCFASEINIIPPGFGLMALF